MIDAIGGFLKHNLVVLAASVLILFKVCIVRLVGDKEAQGVTMMSIPEDLSYVALGLILGDITTSAGAFRRHFRNSSHPGFDIFVCFGLSLTVAVLLNLASRFTNSSLKDWRAATTAYDQHRQSYPLSIASENGELRFVHGASDNNYRMIIVRHMYKFGTAYAFQYVLVITWMIWIAKVIASE